MKWFSKPTHTQKPFDVITIGSAVVDEYARSPRFELTPSVKAPDGFDTCFPMGAKLALDDLTLETGGGATNAATTFARLGFKTGTVCRVGHDVFGDLILKQLKKERIATSFVQHDRTERTGQSIILLANIGYRTILAYRGAGAHIDHKEIPWKSLTPRWFYVTSLGGDLGLFSLILDRAATCGARVAWNPGNAELEKGIARLTPLLRRVDVVSINREEAALLTHQPSRHFASIIEKLGALPKIALLVSDGPKGAYLHARHCTWHAPALPGKRVNTTGAGDALGSGFVAGFMATCDSAYGFRVGMLNSLGVITHMGAKAGIIHSWPKDEALAKVKIKIAKLNT
jgi:sugar/nucleoside kinase (ribokinase family)